MKYKCFWIHFKYINLGIYIFIMIVWPTCKYSSFVIGGNMYGDVVICVGRFVLSKTCLWKGGLTFCQSQSVLSFVFTKSAIGLKIRSRNVATVYMSKHNLQYDQYQNIKAAKTYTLEFNNISCICQLIHSVRKLKVLIFQFLTLNDTS